jgi:hypothetical protein
MGTGPECGPHPAGKQSERQDGRPGNESEASRDSDARTGAGNISA